MPRARQNALISKVFLFSVLAVASAAEAANNKTDSAKAADPDAYTLRYQFKKDEVLHYRVDHESTLIASKPELSQRTKNEVHSKKNQRVVATDSAGNATLELAIDWVKMSAQFDDSEARVFDSKHPDDCPDCYKGVRQVIGQPLARVRVSPRGTLLSSTPLLSPAVLARARMLPPDPSSESNDPMRNFLVEFPEEPLKIGEGWTNTYKVKVQVTRRLSQDVTMQRSYELTEVKDQRATIKMRTALITPIRDGQILGQLIQMTPSGTIVFDLEHGRIVSRTLAIDKTEVGVIGGNGSMQAKSKRVECWIDPAKEKADSEPKPKADEQS